MNAHRFLIVALLPLAAAVSTKPATAAQTVSDGGPVAEVVVELSSPAPVSAWIRDLGARGRDGRRHAPLAEGTRALRDRARTEQRLLIDSIEGDVPDARILYTLDRLANAVAVRVPAAEVRRLSSLPGVTSVRPLIRYRPTTRTSVPLIGGPAVWDPSFGGLTGRSVTIGIIDSGIDYIHKDFGGSGSYAGQRYDDSQVPWTAKVVGGWDFVGDDYDGTNTAAPDGDPMDCGGHGTHVAGIAAGYGVTAAGATYTGPWSETIDMDGLAIGPGVAPEAELYALKVFGCDGSTSYAYRAVDWAIDPNDDGDFSDHLDVVNLSLGSTFGGRDATLEELVDRASAAGMAVVAAAGNDGDTFFSAGSPASADAALSVANSDDGSSWVAGFRVNTPAAAAGVYPATEASFGPDLASIGDRTGDLAFSPANADGCAAFASGSLTGRTALVRRGSCYFTDKVLHAQSAGAAGVLVVNNVADDILVMGGSATGITIPAMLTTLETGAVLEAALGAGPVSVTLTASFRNQIAFVAPTAVDTLSASTSRGPRVGDLALKPDLTAPGSSILSAEARSGTGAVSLSGTSMATPHAAGAVAVVRQLHPDWSVSALKALLMNTASHDLGVVAGGTPPYYGTGRAGAGRIDLVDAATATATVEADDGTGRVSVSFGSLEVAVPTVLRRPVRVDNRGSAVATFTLSYRPLTAVDGVTVLPSVDTVTVDPGASATFDVILRADPSRITRARAAGVSPTQDGVDRFWMTEVTGLVLLRQPAGSELRLPVYAAVRPTAEMAAAESVVPMPTAAGSFDLHLTGRSVATGTGPANGVESLVVPLEHMGSSGAVRAVGVWSDYAALQRTGGDTGAAVIAFGIALPRWSTPHEASPVVRIGTNEYTVELTDRAPEDGLPLDTFASQVCTSASGSCVVQFPVNYVSPAARGTALFNNEVMVLYARAANLGLGGATTSLSFRVASGRSTTATFQYDIADPGVDFVGSGAVAPGMYPDVDGQVLSVAYDRAALEASGAPGILLLHLHGAAGSRYEAIDLAGDGCSLSCTADVPAASLAGSGVPFEGQASATGCGGTPTFSWDPGDGAGALSGPSSEHAYADEGSYRWQLTVTAGSRTCVKSGSIAVSSSPMRPIRHLVGRQ